MDKMNIVFANMISFITIITLLKKFVISDVEKKIEPYYMKKLRKFLQEMFYFIILVLFISMWNYNPFVYNNFEKLCYIISFVFFLSYVFSESKKFSNAISNKPSLSILKKIFDESKSFESKFATLNIASIFMFIYVINNTFLEGMTGVFGVKLEDLMDVFFHVIDLGKSDYFEIIIVLILLLSIYLVFYMIFRAYFKSSIRKIISLESKEYYHITLKNGDFHYNTLFLSCNNDAYIVSENSGSTQTIIFRDEISKIEITKLEKIKIENEVAEN